MPDLVYRHGQQVEAAELRRSRSGRPVLTLKIPLLLLIETNLVPARCSSSTCPSATPTAAASASALGWNVCVRLRQSATRSIKDVIGRVALLRDNVPVFGVFPMFVLSLSW